MRSSYHMRERRFDPASLGGLVVDLDARDVSAGAITTINSRVNSYVFNGNATRGMTGWAGGFTRFLVFNRALAADEMLRCARLIGRLSSIGV